MGSLPVASALTAHSQLLPNNQAERVREIRKMSSKDEIVRMNDPNEPEEANNDCCSMLLTIFSLIFIVLTFPISIFFCIRIVPEYERAIIFRLGRLKKGGAVGPGLFFIIPCIDEIKVVDLRTITFDVPPQEVLTKDSVTVQVDAVVYYNIKNPMAAVCKIENYSHATKLLSATTLRNVLGTKTLSETLSERDTIAKDLKTLIDDATDPWGIDIQRVEVKDVRLPQNLQRAMAAEAEASREARAKVIAAEGEQKASKALKEASDIISESPAALQLRYLQTLATISSEKNSTIVFPIPIELMAQFTRSKQDWN